MICFTGCWSFLGRHGSSEERSAPSEKSRWSPSGSSSQLKQPPKYADCEGGECDSVTTASTRSSQARHFSDDSQARSSDSSAAPSTPRTPLSGKEQPKDGQCARRRSRQLPGGNMLRQTSASLRQKCMAKLQTAVQKLGGSRQPLADGGEGTSSPVVSGRLVKQPKDGSCLFHSIACGMGDKTGSAKLRKEIAAFIAAHPCEKIANTAIEDWVKMVSGLNHRAYAASLAEPHTWGGDLELAIATRIKDIQINVYEPDKTQGNSFRRIASFSRSARMESPCTVSVVYSAAPCRHYDALFVDDMD